MATAALPHASRWNKIGDWSLNALKACGRSLWHFFVFPFLPEIKVLNEPDVKAEIDWFQKEFLAKTGVDYTAAQKWAEEKYKDIKDISASLDKKAEGYYGLAFATIGAAWYVAPAKNIGGLAWSIPSILFSFLAIKSAMRVRTPGDRPSPMIVREAMRTAEGPETFAPVIAGNFHCAIEALKKGNTWRADNLRNASRAQLAALIALVLTIPAQSPPAEAVGLSSGEHKIRVVGRLPDAPQVDREPPVAVQPERPAVRLELRRRALRPLQNSRFPRLQNRT
jgi:hypothetical protein